MTQAYAKENTLVETLTYKLVDIPIYISLHIFTAPGQSPDP